MKNFDIKIIMGFLGHKKYIFFDIFNFSPFFCSIKPIIVVLYIEESPRRVTDYWFCVTFNAVYATLFLFLRLDEDNPYRALSFYANRRSVSTMLFIEMADIIKLRLWLKKLRKRKSN